MLNQRDGHVPFGVTPNGNVVGQHVSELSNEPVEPEEGVVYQRRQTPYGSKCASLDMRTRLCDSAWAMSILSKGSRWGPGSAPARAPSSTVTGSSSKPWSAMAPATSRATASAFGSLPRRCLVAISQADAALINTSFASFSIARRAASDNRSLPASHQRNAWVSSRSRNAYVSQAESSASGSGSKKLSSITIRPRNAPNCRLPWR